MADFNLVVGAKVDTSDIQSQLDKMPKKATVTTKVKFDGAEATKEVTTYTDKLGNMATVTKITADTGEQLSNKLTKVKTVTNDVSSSLDKASTSAKNVGTNFNHSSREGQTLANQFVDITKKVLAFGTATQVIMLFRQGISEAIDIVMKFDDTLTEFKKVSDLSGESLTNYTDKLSEMGKEVARTGREMLESATLFKKTGSTEEEAALLAKTSELYRNIADEQINSSQASEYLVSQMKAFNVTAQDSIKIVDMLNEVDVYLPLNNYIG